MPAIFGVFKLRTDAFSANMSLFAEFVSYGAWNVILALMKIALGVEKMWIVNTRTQLFYKRDTTSFSA